MKIDIKDEQIFIIRIKRLIKAYDFAKKLTEIIEFSTVEGNELISTPATALSMIFLKNDDNEKEEYRFYEILDNSELTVDQKMALLFSLSETNIIQE